MYIKKVSLTHFSILIAAIIVNLLFLGLFRYDNKYLNTKPSGSNGYLTLTEEQLEQHGVIPIVNGFLYFPGKLNDTPEIPSERPYFSNIAIGHNRNFTYQSNSPFGTATYQITIDSPIPLLMEVPEIYSASKVWVNGQLTLANGSFRPYQPYIQAALVYVPANGAEIVIQAANYTHYYSGLIFPPIVGAPDAMNRMICIRLLFYGMLCFFTLGTATAFIAVWFRSKDDKLHLYYGLLCLFFVLHVSYPFWTRLGVRFSRLAYCVEDSAWFLMVLCIMVITHLITANYVPAFIQRCFITMGIFFSLLPPIFSFFIFQMLPNSVYYYGHIMGGSKIIFGLYLLLCALFGTNEKIDTRWLLAGNAIFGIGLLTDWITAGNFEPIYLGWQTEYSSFLLILLFLILMLRYHSSILYENQQFTTRLQHEIERKTWHLQLLLNERKLFISSVAHDLKAPASIIQTYITLIRTKRKDLDKDTIQYLNTIENKAIQMQGQIRELQEFNREAAESEPAITIDLNAFLQRLYEDTKPYADAVGIYYYLTLPNDTVPLFCQTSRLARALENIILNATHYTPPNGQITLLASYQNGQAEIQITDTGQGIAPEHLGSIFDYRFSTQNQGDDIAGGTHGLGLYFAKLTIQELGGNITVTSALGKGATFRILLPLQDSCRIS